MRLTRVSVVAAVVLAVALSGCAGVGDGCAYTEATVRVYPVDDRPVDAPVTNSTAVESVELDRRSLGEVLGQVAETGEPASVQVQRRAVCRVDDALAELPRHDGDRGGYYLRHDGAVVRVVMEFPT